jgi:hypothetical protein
MIVSPQNVWMQLRTDAITGPELGERSAGRLNQATGSGIWSPAGTVGLRILKLWRVSYFPPFLEPWPRAEMASTSDRQRWREMIRALVHRVASDRNQVEVVKKLYR